WSPLGRGKTLTNEAIAEIGARYGKSNAQVCLRWLIQLGMLPLPKSGNIERMKQNLEVFDFELTLEEMAVISAQENPTGRFWDADEIDF
ncbi:MAG: aldo/keto reductase, partial [Eggerthellaceae bacterium]|nr:aldo/keto reductase [Eggerthellaceae bacterium]